MMAATKINLTKMHAHLLALTWYGIVPTKNFQHKNLLYESCLYNTKIFQIYSKPHTMVTSTAHVQRFF